MEGYPMFKPFTSKSVAILITGASRGFGRSIAIATLNLVLSLGQSPMLHFVLHGSQASEELHRTENQMHEIAEQHTSTRLSTVLVGTKLDSPDSGALAAALNSEAWRSADEHFLFNNAGVLGRTGETSATLRFNDYLAPMVLNAVAMGEVASLFLSSTDEARPGGRYVVHTSSKASQCPIKSWAPYAMSKAAAEMLHSTIAAEFVDFPRRTRVLQWAPGPMCTDMTAKARESGATPSTSLRWVNPDESAEKLLSILAADGYKSGAHIDFFDDPSNESQPSREPAAVRLDMARV
jgi:NAD(P)-dependent dehydrogenase (short-subunit alcohol dehydrogenase family)